MFLGSLISYCIRGSLGCYHLPKTGEFGSFQAAYSVLTPGVFGPVTERHRINIFLSSFQVHSLLTHPRTLTPSHITYLRNIALVFPSSSLLMCEIGLFYILQTVLVWLIYLRSLSGFILNQQL